MTKDYILEIKNLHAGYDQTPVIKDVNLNLSKDEFLGIIGPNGGGKTTLLKVILGLIQPLKGELNFDIAPGDIGYLPQRQNIDPSFPVTVREIVLSGLRTGSSLFRKISSLEKERMNEVLNKTGIYSLKDRSIGKISGGQLQRTMLARAIVSSPSLLILDEPETFVDSGFEQELYPMLTELNKQMAILLVSHDLGIISSYVKNIACVNGGVHYHKTNKITQQVLDSYNCPIDLIAHGRLPHRVLHEHE